MTHSAPPPSMPPPPPHGRPPAKTVWWQRAWIVGVAAGVIGIGVGAASAGGSDSKDADAAPASTVTATATITNTATVAATVTARPVITKVTKTKIRTETKTYTPPPPAEFTNGTYVVGVDIKPGTYHSDGGDGYCAWVRASDESGTDIIDLGNTSNGPLTVKVEKDDGSLVIQGDCAFSRR